MKQTELEIGKLYELYGGMVLRRCRAILNSEHLAMDALQDVFVQLIRKQKDIKANGYSSLLYRMATNTSFNMLRHQQVRDDYVSEQEAVLQSQDHDDPSTENEIINMDRISKALNKFPERTREAAIYHYVDGFTMDEIANMMHMSNSNTRRILRELRQVIPAPENVK